MGLIFPVSLMSFHFTMIGNAFLFSCICINYFLIVAFPNDVMRALEESLDDFNMNPINYFIFKNKFLRRNKSSNKMYF